MSWNTYSFFLGARRAVTRPRMPKGYARLTAAVLDNPVAMIAFVAADSRVAAPISEIMANARILDIEERLSEPQGLSANTCPVITTRGGDFANARLTAHHDPPANGRAAAAQDRDSVGTSITPPEDVPTSAIGAAATA
jgi:hypothetical protein